jgi:hypothetical protein
MKLKHLERVNHLVTQLDDIRRLTNMAEQADPAAFQLFIEAPGDSSLRMSQEGASTTHSLGVATSRPFLEELKRLGVAELRSRQGAILEELSALGVDPRAE